MKSLAEIKGQTQVVAQLKKVLASHRLSHAYLFLGPEGVGKKTTAYAFAAALCCSQSPSLGELCGQCPACIKMAHGSHPDIITVQPESTSIKIEQIRELQSLSAYKHLNSPYKIIIIDEAQKMTEEAANAMLKILEEPPKDTVFILVAHGTKGLLSTIVSRCQLLRFKPLTPEVIQEILKEETSLPEEDVKILSRLARGSVSLGLKLWENWGQEEKWRMPQKILEHIIRKDRTELLRLSAGLEKDPYLKFTLESLMGYFRDLLVWQKTGCAKLVYNQEIINNKGSIGELPNPSHAILLINQALKRLEQNANTRLTLDVLFLKLTQ